MSWTKCDICHESCSKETMKKHPEKIIEIKQKKGFTKYYHLKCIQNEIPTFGEIRKWEDFIK